MMNTEILLGSLKNRLLKAEAPIALSGWYESKNFSYVQSCLVSVEDIPELIDVGLKWFDDEWFEAWNNADVDKPTYAKCVHLPIHAWRALAELKADQCAAPLLSVLNDLADNEDDWGLEEAPRVLGSLSPAVVPLLVEFADQTSNDINARTIVVDALAKLAKQAESQGTRGTIVATLNAWLLDAVKHPVHFESNREALDSDPVQFNTAVLMGLLDLNATESAEIIERAFAANQLDTGFAGDWSAVKGSLKVSGLELDMPDNPLNSLSIARAKMGFGVFSDSRLFVDGEPDDEALRGYYENACEQFAASDEGKEVIEKSGSPGWVSSFLRYGIEYLGETVDTMTCRDVDEILFDIFPRKVSVEPDSAGDIIFELRNFWRFVDRVHHCPEAEKIVGLLDNKSIRRLRSELSNPANFGMAKSMVMMGRDTGFDMTSQAGINEFMMAYNAQISQQLAAAGHFDLGAQPSQRFAEQVNPAAPVMSAAEKKALDKQRKKQLAAKLKQKKNRK